jgi:hypothetical protein
VSEAISDAPYPNPKALPNLTIGEPLFFEPTSFVHIEDRRNRWPTESDTTSSSFTLAPADVIEPFVVKTPLRYLFHFNTPD